MSGYRVPGPVGTGSVGTPGPVGKNDEAEQIACSKAVSWELADACLLPDAPGAAPTESVAARKVGSWLIKNRSLIVDAEHEWCVDRRAIAGAIAFEAMEDVQSSWRHTLSKRSFGPGKIHIVNWYSNFYESSTTVEQTEQAGYLQGAGIRSANLKQQLATVSGSITCIAAVMRADADAARVIGGYSAEETHWNPPVLAAWFQGKTLKDLVQRFQQESMQRFNQPNPLGQRRPSLDPGAIPMGVWVRGNLEYLERYVGKPDKCADIKPIAGAKDLTGWAYPGSDDQRQQIEFDKRLQNLSKKPSP